MIRDERTKFNNLINLFFKIFFYPLKIKIINAGIKNKLYYILFTWVNLSLAIVNYFMKKLKLGFMIKEVLIDRDLIVENKMGIFYVRKLTTDHTLVADHYEENIKIYFDKMKDGIFIDIGANIGKWSVYMAKKLNENSKIIAIEPLLENYRSLVRNIELNNLKNIIPLPLALSDIKKDAYMVKVPINLGESFLLTSPQNYPLKGNETYKVTAKPLNEVIKELNLNINEIKLLKIDVEGHELKVFEGAETLLKHSSNLMIIFESFEENIKNVENFLKKFNFKICKIDRNNYFAFKNMIADGT